MPATENELALIRFKTGDDDNSLSDDIINMLFDEAEAKYTDYSRDVIKQAVVVERYRNFVASHRQDVTYKQNETSENTSDISKGYAQDLAREETRLSSLLSSEKPLALRTAVSKRVPSRTRSFPNG